MYEQEVIQIVRTNTAFMGSVDGNRPRVRPMKPFIDREGRIWLFSRYDSHKVAQIEENPRVELCFMTPSQEVLTIYGRLKDDTKPGTPTFRVLRDLMIAEIPDMKHYFKEGEEDKIVIYRLAVHEIRYMRSDCELTTRVNLPMEHNPDIDLAMCQGGFCLMS